MSTKLPTFLEVLQWSEEECRAYLEAERWPDGPVCPKCGGREPWTITRKAKGKNVNRTLYKCKACKRQFTVTVGTIFEDSHIPLSKWFAAIFLMVSSKKGVSAHQLHRELEVTYRSAWFMCHRIREAMREKGPRPLLTGIVEADETYIGGKLRGSPRQRSWRHAQEVRQGTYHPHKGKIMVLGMLQRNGEARTITLPYISGPALAARFERHIDFSNARLISDGHPAYREMGRRLPHDAIDHNQEYVRGDVHTQGIESYWAILKRGMIGVYHKADAGYLPGYLSEFEYRFNRRKITDSERFADLVGRTRGRLDWYCRTPQPVNPHA